MTPTHEGREEHEITLSWNPLLLVNLATIWRTNPYFFYGTSL
jgi:hypothetical protein